TTRRALHRRWSWPMTSWVARICAPMVRGAFGPNNDPSLEQEQSDQSPPAVIQQADLKGAAAESPPQLGVDGNNNDNSNVHESTGTGNIEATAPGAATDANGRRDGEGVGGEPTVKPEGPHHADADCNESVVGGDTTKRACDEKGVVDAATVMVADTVVVAAAAFAAAAAGVASEAQGGSASAEEARQSS
ncbi:unnamed protein product, partial [Laminaria digitata]